jgi:S1-C subfamily serine protease
MVPSCKEAIRIVRTIEASFPSGPSKTGSAFLAPVSNRLITCAHVVVNDQNQRASRVFVTGNGTTRYEANLSSVDENVDLATLEIGEGTEPSKASMEIPEIGEQVIYAGKPVGIKRSSVFPGMISASGSGLLSTPSCDLIQIVGMVNNGNSGGPLVNSDGKVLGVITAKYVPLLVQIDKLTQDLEKIPQFPRGVLLGRIDFSAFVNVTVQSMWQIATVLRLVQVGVGWAVPAKYLYKVGGV